jgi:hypothetical protein
MASLQMIERLGGNKSTGKGKCCCKVTEVAINGTSYTEEDWQSWLDHLDTLSLYSTALDLEEEE